ncbi:MAG TPA: DHHA1 domain-containing protein, partial [Opitutaceae bacterium]
QVGDTGTALIAGVPIQILDTVKDKAGRHLHKIDPASASSLQPSAFSAGSIAELSVDMTRRRAIQRHHTATHLLHNALRKVLGTHVRQAGSLNAPDRLRFDFAHFEAVKPEQLREIETIVNQHIIDNAEVDSYETEFDKKPEGTLAFFGEKYGKVVRVVDVGGYSRELCGGTHVGTTGEIGLVKIISEGAVAAGTRRLEAVAGQAAIEAVEEQEARLRAVSAKLNAAPSEVEKKLDALLAQKAELERKVKAFEQKAAAGIADDLVQHAVVKDGLKFISAIATVETPDALRALGSQVLAKASEGVVVLGGVFGDKASVVAFCSPAAIKAGHQAGKIIADLSGKLGGKGGGKPDFAMGGGKETAKLAEILKA